MQAVASSRHALILGRERTSFWPVTKTLARTSVGDILLRKAGPRLQTLAKGFQEDAFSYLLFVRLVPAIPFWVTNLAAAIFGVRLKTFALATLIGIIPATFAFATGAPCSSRTRPEIERPAATLIVPRSVSLPSAIVTCRVVAVRGGPDPPV